jgi:UTP-glucose-1-phosphate uridylyltransferase
MKPTLLVLAAGLGTRYGGLKQIDAVGPCDQTLIDYAIYDGIRAGFSRVVFVIRHCFEDAFRAKVSGKFDRFVETAYTYQELDTCLGDFDLAGDRQKPWGTGHAILVSREAISGPFAVINADDFYGAGSFEAIVRFLVIKSAGLAEHAMVGYTLRNTLSEYGAVARGVTKCDDHMFLKTIIECTEIRRTADGICGVDGDGKARSLTGSEIVSMNLWGFRPSVFDELQAQFERFLRAHGKVEDSEFYIPSAVDEMIAGGKASVRVLPTEDQWFGITYRQDRDVAARCIRGLTGEGVYPEKLWR